MTTTCERCGQPHPKCTAHNRRGGPCGLPKVDGLPVCRQHGGSAPHAIAAAERRVKEREAMAGARLFGLPVDVDPAEALLEELHRTAGEVAWLGSIVAELEKDDAIWGMTREKVGGDDRGTTHEAGLNIWIQTWHAQRRHLTNVARECLKAGIEERRVQLAETQGAMLAGVVRAILNRLDLTTEQQQLVAVVVPQELRRIAELPPGGTP